LTKEKGARESAGGQPSHSTATSMHIALEATCKPCGDKANGFRAGKGAHTAERHEHFPGIIDVNAFERGRKLKRMISRTSNEHLASSVETRPAFAVADPRRRLLSIGKENDEFKV
jgi:hypothetical protein